MKLQIDYDKYLQIYFQFIINNNLIPFFFFLIFIQDTTQLQQMFKFWIYLICSKKIDLLSNLLINFFFQFLSEMMLSWK